jgi:arsenite methyltransferase
MRMPVGADECRSGVSSERRGRRDVLRSAQVLAALILLSIGADAGVSAQLASRPVDEWLKVLDSPDRLASLKTEEVIATLKLQPGTVVADLGAGSGPFVVPFARTVGTSGKVYAVDVDRNFFPHIEAKAKSAGVTNVQIVLGEFTDPKLPAADVDLAFLHDVLHHIENREGYLKSLATYLKPAARVVVIDFHPAQSPHTDQPALQISKEQSAAWLAQAGFEPVDEFALFKEKWFVVYARKK